MNRQSDLDNHANQLNSNNDAYWESRGFDERVGEDPLWGLGGRCMLA